MSVNSEVPVRTLGAPLVVLWAPRGFLGDVLGLTLWSQIRFPLSVCVSLWGGPVVHVGSISGALECKFS